MSNSSFIKNFNLYASCAALIGMLVWGEQAFAEAQNLTQIASNLQGNIKSLDTLLTIISYVSGIGFCIAGILQFKAHKDNPQQVPLSKPIVFVCVGAGLLFLPSIMASAGSTIFGSQGGVSAGKAQTGLDS